MLVKDTIHHGNYYDERVVEVLPIFQRFVQFLNSGPYGAGDHVKCDNRFAVEAYKRLMETGESDFGWRRFEVIRWGAL